MLNFTFQGNRPLRQELTSARLNEILKELRRLRPVAGRGVNIQAEPNGSRISILDSPTTGGGAGGPTFHPFQIFSRQNPDNENQYLVTVRPGTINALLPSGIFNGANLAETSIGKDQLSYVVLDAASDGEQITTASVSVESSAPAAQIPAIFSLPTSAQFLLGVVYNASVFQVQFTNISVAGKQQFVADKLAPAAPGQLPYDIYFVWG